MTDIKQLAKNLRRYNAWRRGAEGVETPIPKDLSKWIEEAANALDCLTEPKPIKCETCEGAGKIDERLGGYHTSNANAQCPDCDGAGYLESIHDFRPGQWWVKELDGIQASQEATPDQKRAVAVVHNLLRHILKLELPGNVLAQRVEKLESELKHWKSNHAAEVQRARVLKERTDMPLERVQAYEQIGQLLAERDALAAELKALREQEPVARLLDRISDAMQSYERHGAICMFEGSPMIYASTLTEIADIAAEAQQVERVDNLIGLRG